MNDQRPTTLLVGASSSFGEGIARILSSKGHALILAHSGRGTYRVPEGAEGKVITFDVTGSDAVVRALDGYGVKINNVVYCVSAPIAFTAFKDEQWGEYEKHWQVQAGGLWRVVHSLLAHHHVLKRIVVVGSSVTIAKPMPRLGAYVTAKYALLGLVRHLAAELAANGVRANMVSPGATGTGLSKDWPNAFLQAGEAASSEAVAAVVASLLHKNNIRTGENIPV